MFSILSQLWNHCSRTPQAPRRRPSRTTNRKARLQMETLEDRTVMSVLTGTHVVTSGGLAGAFAPAPPTAAGLALISSLPDTPVRSAALADYQRDGLISRNDMLDILNQGTSGYTWLTVDEFSSLQTLVTNGPTVGMSDYVQNLALKSLLPVSKEMQTVGPDVVASDLLLAVNNYFLGMVHPDDSYTDDNGETVTPPYQAVNLPLWNKYPGPSYQDVRQGIHVNDCWLMASLAEVAARNPGDIQSMFIDNGDQSYTVRFYNGSRPDYVTVDNYLPDGNSVSSPSLSLPYDNPQLNLWAALAEKAYAQENAAGWIGSPQPRVDSYQALGLNNGGYANWALSAITGQPTSLHAGYSGGVWWNFGGPSISATALANAWSQGSFLVLGTYQPPSSLVVPKHAYAVVGYSSGWFTLFNPWGTNGGWEGNQHYPGFIEVDATGLANSFNSWAQTGAAAGLSVPAATTSAGLSQTDVKPAMFRQDQIQTSLSNNASTAVAVDSALPLDRALLESLDTSKNLRVAGMNRRGNMKEHNVNELEIHSHDLVWLNVHDKTADK
jgi:Calpain family cysteine protease